jgi:hypothetical protein
LINNRLNNYNNIYIKCLEEEVQAVEDHHTEAEVALQAEAPLEVITLLTQTNLNKPSLILPQLILNLQAE